MLFTNEFSYQQINKKSDKNWHCVEVERVENPIFQYSLASHFEVVNWHGMHWGLHDWNVIEYIQLWNMEDQWLRLSDFMSINSESCIEIKKIARKPWQCFFLFWFFRANTIHPYRDYFFFILFCRKLFLVCLLWLFAALESVIACRDVDMESRLGFFPVRMSEKFHSKPYNQRKMGVKSEAKRWNEKKIVRKKNWQHDGDQQQ